MKKGILVLLFCGLASFCFAQNAGGRNSHSFTFDREESYAVGMYIGTQFEIPYVHYDYLAFMEGFRAYIEGLESMFSIDEAITKIQAVFDKYESWYMSMIDQDTLSDANAESNREQGLAFLAENAWRFGVNTRPSGLQYEVVREGGGRRPTANDTVRVHYEGTLIDGTVFDSSYRRGEPIEFSLDRVIEGWTEGLQLMSEGSIYNLYIPSELGYGSYSTGTIPGNSVLIFRVELLSVIRY
jgi:FKBP-type peptidyl-prolyl cis-trans isomerase FkpA